MKRADENAGSSVPGIGSSEPAARVVARIVDPLVRDDGRGEPQLILKRQAIGDEPGGGEASRGSSHPVRDRLLAKARAASRGVDAPGASSRAEGMPLALGSRDAPPMPPAPNGEGVEGEASFDETGSSTRLGFESLPQLAADDLDLIGAPERRRLPRSGRPAPALAAPSALLLGTLFGVTTMAVLFAVLIQVAPRDPLGVRSRAVETLEAPRASTEPEPVRKVRRPPRQRVPGPWRIAQAEHDPALRIIHGSVGGSSFLAAMQAAGANLREAYRVMAAFDGVKDLNRCRPKDAFRALLDASSGRLAAFEYSVSDEEVYQAREGDDGRLLGRKLDLKPRRDRVSGVIVVQGEFEAASLAAGFEPGLSEVVNKALSGYSSVAELRQGDVLALVAQEVTVLGDFSRYAGVEALEYRSHAAEPLRIYYHETEKSRGYVDSKGRVFGKSRWSRPVPGAAVTSRFNPRRMHPILKRIQPHNGIDFGAPIGTPVVTAAAGKVVFVGKAGPNGNMISIEHSGGYETSYSHLSRFARGLRVGARVEQKQLIGYVGSTGRSTGPHLHFAAKKSHRFIDPELLNLDGFSRLALSDRELLTTLRQRYDQLLDSLSIPAPRAPEVVPEVAHSEALVVPAGLGSASTPPSPDPTAPTHSTAIGAAHAPAPTLSIYMTDQELIQHQPASHEGEVNP